MKILSFNKAEFALLLFYFSSILQAQDTVYFNKTQDQLLNSYLDILNHNINDRAEASYKFYENVFRAIEAEGSFKFGFDKLKNIGKIYSPDKKIRVYTWNIPSGLNSNLYFGFIQYYSDRTKSYCISKLIQSDKNPEKISPEIWPGALYYQVVKSKHAGQKYYTLLGFDLNNILSNKKVIDIIGIDEFDELYFCENMINFKGKLVNRLAFEYSEKASMVLRYEENKKMIIFDHLSPQKPSYEGKYQFYGPDFTYDGLKFEKGAWVYYSNIDITN